MGQLINSLDEAFKSLDRRSRELISSIPEELLYKQPRSSPGAVPLRSCGELILRSAAAVEQTFGGITANLWDDPFEWTLPETLSTPGKVGEYLEEVEITRQRAFELFRGDEDLCKEIVAPSGSIQLISLLIDTLMGAKHQQEAALEIFKRVTTDPQEKKT